MVKEVTGSSREVELKNRRDRVNRNRNQNRNQLRDIERKKTKKL